MVRGLKSQVPSSGQSGLDDRHWCQKGAQVRGAVTHPSSSSLTALQMASGLCPRRSHLRRSPRSLPSAQPGTGGLGHLTPPSLTVGCVVGVCGAHTHRWGPRAGCRAEPPSLPFSILYRTFPGPRGGASACGHLRQGAPAHGGTWLCSAPLGCSPAPPPQVPRPPP